MRLNRYIAMATGLSRRQADDAIVENRVSINGTIATLGDQASDTDTVSLDNVTISTPNELMYLVLHKPAGYVTSRTQQGTHKTIYALLPESYHRLKPVGRLDRETSGLILLTDDGEAAFALSHPSFVKTKRYEVVLDRILKDEDADKLRAGIMLEDGLSTFDSLSGKGKNWELTLHEGKNRQIRRSFAALNYRVMRLHRSHFGKLSLDGLAQNDYKFVKKSDLL
ncbi:MAG: pseudouridine synthase [Candidatus Saccharibacteria bacterium]